MYVKIVKRQFVTGGMGGYQFIREQMMSFWHPCDEEINQIQTNNMTCVLAHSWNLKYFGPKYRPNPLNLAFKKPWT